MSAPRLRGLLLRLRQAGAALHPQQQYQPQYQPQQLLPAFAIATTIDGGATAPPSSFLQHQTRAKRTVRVVLKRDDPVTGGRAGDVVRVPAGRQRLDLFPSGAADYATPRAVREARAEAAAAAATAAGAEGEQPSGAAADNTTTEEDHEQASLERALQALESKAVVVRRRGKPVASSATATAATDGGAAGGGGGDEGGSSGSSARLIGRVTRADVARAVERQLGVALDDRLLLMGDEGIRAFGEYRVPLNVAVAAAGAGGGGGGGEAAAAGARGRGAAASASAAAGDGARRRQAHVRVDVVRTWR